MNYQTELEKIIHANAMAGRTPSLLLHSCCAPCSSYVIEYLSSCFYITIFYFNPNIYDEMEYRRREMEQRRLIAGMQTAHPVGYIEGRYDADAFLRAVKGLESCPEGGERCLACYRLRLKAAAEEAERGGFDYFATTLTISPQKKADELNAAGMQAAEESKGAKYLAADFKKRGGYQRSVALSKEYGLYRQDFCGCIYSKRKDC